MTLLNIHDNLSWGIERQTLSVNPLAAVVVGLDGEDSILLLTNPAAGIGDLDDIEELLADVGGDDDMVAHGFQGLVPEEGIGPLLSLVGFFEVGVVLHTEVIYAQGEKVPIEGGLSNVDGGLGLGVSADLGMGDDELIGEGASQDAVGSRLVLILVGGGLAGEQVFSEAEGFPGNKFIGNKAQKTPELRVSMGAPTRKELGIVVVYGIALGGGGVVPEADAEPAEVLVKDFPDPGGLKRRIVPAQGVASGPGGGQAPEIEAEEGQGRLRLLGQGVLPGIHPIVEVGDGFVAGRRLVAELEGDFAA